MIYKPTTQLEKFGQKVYSFVVENFSSTYFVGGMVRDLLLHRNVTDIDIATSATPSEVVKILTAKGITINDSHKQFGNIIATQGKLKIQVTTFRKDLAGASRYHTILYVKTPKADSQRRDFTINALYLRPKSRAILDFYNGFSDLKSGIIRFIGAPEKRIKQDPLRIIRALRFALILKFRLETKTKIAIKNNFQLINKLTRTKTRKEILKIKNLKTQKILQLVINKPELLDNYFK